MTEEPVASQKAPSGFSAVRFATILGAATGLGQASQLVWLTAGSRTMSITDFGTVLAAQALYGILVFVVDGGSAFYGARLEAQDQLNAERLGSVVRVRLQAAALAAIVVLAVGLTAGRTFLLAAAPFALALFLFALFAFWVPFGRGESGPWSAFSAGRGLAPASAALACLALGASFPVWLAGVLESAVILTVALAFGLRPFHHLRLGLLAHTAPWRDILTVGLPTVVSQIGLASGTVLLAATGKAAAAAVLGVAVRLLTGVNQLSGLLATALFPHLAQNIASGDPDDAQEDASIGVGLALTFAVAAAATATFLFHPSFFVELLLDHSDPDAEATTILALAAGGAVGYLLIWTIVLIAHRRESEILRAYLLGTGLIVAGSVAVVVASPGDPALAIAATFVAGQVASVLLVARRARRAVPAREALLRRGAVGAVAFAACVATAALWADTRPLVLILVAIAAVALVAWVFRRRRAYALTAPMDAAPVPPPP